MSNNTITVRLDGLDALTRLVHADLQTAAGNAAFAVGTQLQANISPYPPSTSANAPRAWQSKGRNSWYERGFGPRWARKDGSIGGRKLSQTLNRRWSIQRNGNQTVVANIATYGAYVHRGGTEQPHQAGFHTARGWRTDVQGIRELEQTGVVNAIVRAEVARVTG